MRRRRVVPEFTLVYPLLSLDLYVAIRFLFSRPTPKRSF